MTMPASTEILTAEIAKSNAWVIACSDLLTGVTVPGGQRMNVAVALLHLCNEHHQAIHLLVSQRINGSAFALFRSQFEAYVRAIWIYYRATDTQLADFLKEKQPPPLNQLIESVEQLPAYAIKALSETYNQVYKILCSFAHGGAIQVKARVLNGIIDENYLPEHVAHLLKASALFSMMAAHSIAQIVHDVAVAGRVPIEYAKIYNSFSAQLEE